MILYMNLKNNKMQNNNYTFQIYYSKEYKLYDFTIFYNNKFDYHNHFSNKKDIIKLINKTLKKL